MPDRIAIERDLRQLRADYLNAVECGDDETSVPTGAIGVALAEIDRLNAELAKYVGWEPTVREEYQHACGLLDRIEGIVKFFDADRRAGKPADTDEFVASLKHNLEMN